MITLFLYFIVTYLFVGALISGFLFIYLNQNSDFEIKDKILSVDPKGENREYIEKGLKVLREKPYTFLTVMVFISPVVTLLNVLNIFKGEKKN